MMTAWMLESAFRSLMMATVVWAGIKVLRVNNVVVQKTAWILVLIAALAMPGLMRWNLPQPRAAVVVPVQELIPGVVDTPAVNTTTITVFPPPMETSAPIKRWSLSDWKSFVAPVYLTICAVLLLRLIVGLAMAFRIWHRAEPASSLLEPRASVRISADLQTPVTIGSSVVLPESFSEWDLHKLRVVLAHERSHVRQGDFYWQLLTGVYAALFWFSPLSWWLKKEISDLGEAISDGAAIAEAQSRANYAEVLVEFAAERQRPLAGVAMARSSNIRRRVDRLLVEKKFRNAFTTCKWHLAAASVLVPVALVAAIALVRVQAAEAMKLPETALPQIAPIAQAVAVVPALVAHTPVAPIPAAVHAEIARSVTPALVHPVLAQAKASSGSVNIHESTDDDSNSYAIVAGDSTNMYGSWHSGNAFDQVKSKMHGNYIWFERDGKSYVIDDPALVTQAREYFKPMEELGRRQGELGEQQGRLGEEQGRLGELQAKASAPSPDLSKEMADLQASLKKLQDQKLQQDVKQDDLSDMQGRLADLQGKLGEMQAKFGDAQAKIGEKQAEFGDQQAKLGEKQAKLGEQQAALGAQQEQLSQVATQKMKALIDSAMQHGKARLAE
jgi:beta-lactamase regulating signal transducer with metallopeptidase domain